MNAFFEHHKNSIRLHYRCFDRLLLNGLIQPFQQPERVIGFFNTYRQRGWHLQIARAATRRTPVLACPNTYSGDFVLGILDRRYFF